MADQHDESQNNELETGGTNLETFIDEDGYTHDEEDEEAMALFDSMEEDGENDGSGGDDDGSVDDGDGERSGSDDDGGTGGDDTDSAIKLAEKRAKELSGEAPKDDEGAKGGDPGAQDDKQAAINAALELLKAEGVIKDQPAQTQEPPATQPQPKAPRGKISKEQVMQFITDINDEDLPDEPIEFNGENDRKFRLNLKEYAEDLPEQWMATKMLAGAMVNAVLSKMAENGQIMTNAQAQELSGQIQAQGQQNAYWMHMLARHPDAMKFQQDKDFLSWVKGKGDGWMKMASSWDHNDGILVLDAYKAELASKKVADFDKQKGNERQRKVDLHKHTTRGTGGAKKSGGHNESIDEEKLFNEAAAKL